MNVTIYYADGSIESCSTPYPRDLTFDRWGVSIRPSSAESSAWCVGIDCLGEPANEDEGGRGMQRSAELAEARGARSRDGYIGWLQDNVLGVTVDGYPFWPIGGIADDD